MITVEMLAADAALAGLTDEQRNAIALMSKNDEEVVIGNRFREVYNRLDESIAKETGIARNGDEKTYNYLERATRALAAKANSVDGLNSKITELTNERNRLKEQIAKGGDEALQKQLQQATKDLDGVRQQYDALKADYDKAKTDHAAELFGIKIDNELANAKSGLKFKAEFPQAAVDTLLAQAIAKVKGMNPEYIDDGKGGKRLVFKGADGDTLRNPENHLEPYAAGELLQRELKAMGILDEGRRQPGGGTEPPKGGGGAPTTIDVTTARTQVEASEAITRQLMQKGLINGSKQFQEEFTKAWTDNNVQNLPVQ